MPFAFSNWYLKPAKLGSYKKGEVISWRYLAINDALDETARNLMRVEELRRYYGLAGEGGSGLALKHGVSLVNTPGTIDSDYRGLLSLIMINHGKAPFVIKRGERIAQMVIKEVIKAEMEVKEELDETVRSGGGFGHTGS